MKFHDALMMSARLLSTFLVYSFEKIINEPYRKNFVQLLFVNQFSPSRGYSILKIHKVHSQGTKTLWV